MNRLLIGVGLVAALAIPAEGSETTNKQWLGWPVNQRTACFSGAVDATADWKGLTCPDGVTYAVGVLYATEAAERNPAGSIMESIGEALARANCTVGQGSPTAKRQRERL
jgi:hypothetical protein